MTGGKHIEPDTPALPDHVAGLELLRAVRGRGRDAAGLVEVELDAMGDLVDVVVTDLAAEAGARAIASAFTEAFQAARAATTSLLEEHADELAARSRRQNDENLQRLEQIAAQATAQFDEMAAKLTTIAQGGQPRG